jgi:tetratricopeptide (TPR) repeat protein
MFPLARIRLRLALLAGLELAWSAKVVLAILALPTVWIAVAAGPWWNKLALGALDGALAYLVRLSWPRPPRTPRPGAPALEGPVLDRGDAPELLALVGDTSRRIEVRRLESLVVVGGGCEIDVGPLDARRRRLARRADAVGLGFPLLSVLPEPELRAAVAEGLARSKVLLGRPMRRVVWRHELFETRASTLGFSGGRLVWASRRFYPWLLVRYERAAERLYRALELRAEATAAAAAGAEALVALHLRRNVIADLLEHGFWPGVWGAAALNDEPPTEVFETLSDFLAGAMGGDDAERPEPFLDRARLRRTAGELDRRWRDAVGDEWLVAHAEAAAARDRLAELDRAAAEDAIDPHEQLERAALLEQFEGAEAARASYERVLESSPTDPQANFALGAIMLDGGDDAGLLRLSLAMASDESAVLPACDLAVSYLERHGRADEAGPYRERAARRAAHVTAAAAERFRVGRGDTLLPPDPPPDLVPLVLAELRPRPEVKRAFLVRKKVSLDADTHPLHVLFVVRGAAGRRLERGDPAQRLADELGAALEGTGGLQVFVAGSSNALDARIRSLPGALIHARGRLAGIDVMSIAWPTAVGALAVDLLVELVSGLAALDVAAFLAAAGSIAALRYRSLAGRAARP